jgi:hypothetical protein
VKTLLKRKRSRSQAAESAEFSDQVRLVGVTHLGREIRAATLHAG